MKKCFVILALLTTSFVYGYSTQEEEKIYVQPGSIFVASNGIFLNMEGELYGVSGINVDENGIYIPKPIAGFCGKHGYYPGNSTICPRCQAEKRKK